MVGDCIEANIPSQNVTPHGENQKEGLGCAAKLSSNIRKAQRLAHNLECVTHAVDISITMLELPNGTSGITGKHSHPENKKKSGDESDCRKHRWER